MSVAEQYRAREFDLNRSAQFTAICRGILKNQSPEMCWSALAAQTGSTPHFETARAFVEKASLSSDAWSAEEGRTLSAAYLSEVAGANLVDAMKPFALPIPRDTRVFIASGVIAEGVAEGFAKPTTPLDLTPGEIERGKVAALLVFSDEVARKGGEEADTLFRRLLRDAAIEASNSALLAALPTISVPAGATAVDSLMAGLAAADSSVAYVVAARPALVRELALASDGRMPIAGGEWSPGLIVLPVAETTASPDMVVIPASQIALRDHGLRVDQARSALVDIADPPGSPATPVSLFQLNARALLVERIVEIVGGSPAVAVG